MSKTVSILVTGDEIINGTTLDTNSNFYAQNLYKNKIKPSHIIKVRDSIADTTNALDYLSQKSDCIIISGGLGPTSDDITRYGLKEHLKIELEEDAESLEYIKERLAKINIDYVDQNYQQALFPKGSKVIKNHNGSANACLFESQNGISYFMIPGPPKEAYPIFEHNILPYLINNNFCGDFELKHYRILGIAESVIANQIDEIVRGHEIQTAFCVKMPYLDIFLTGKNIPSSIKDNIEKTIYPYFITESYEFGSEMLKKHIESLNKIIYINDHAIGNSLSSKLFSPETFAFLTSKENADVRIKIEGLKEYWQGSLHRAPSEIQIKIENCGEFQERTITINTRGSETLTIASEYVAVEILKMLNVIKG